MGETVTAPLEVRETLREIQQSGETNMADINTVQYLAHKREEHETVVWLENHPDEYAELLRSWKRR